MPKRITATEDEREIIINEIKETIFGDKNWCILYDLDRNPDVNHKIGELIPKIKSAFLIHNMAGIQRPETLKRPWLSIMRTFLKQKYHIIGENHIVRREGNVIATKRYVLVPKGLIADVGDEEP